MSKNLNGANGTNGSPSSNSISPSTADSYRLKGEKMAQACFDAFAQGFVDRMAELSFGAVVGQHCEQFDWLDSYQAQPLPGSVPQKRVSLLGDD